MKQSYKNEFKDATLIAKSLQGYRKILSYLQSEEKDKEGTEGPRTRTGTRTSLDWKTRTTSHNTKAE